MLRDKLELLIKEYEKTSDEIEVLTYFTYEDGKKTMLEAAINDLKCLLETD